MEHCKENKFVSAVVYMYNDEKYITTFIENLDKMLSDNFNKYEIVIVNDKSKDKGLDFIKKYADNKKESTISVINMSHHQGLESSMNAGNDFAIGDFVFEFDSVYVDYEWDVLMDVYNYALTGYDIVSASVDKKSGFFSRWYYRIFNYYANFENALGQETFRMLSRRAINRIKSITQTIPYRKAAYANCGLKISVLKYKCNHKIKKSYYNQNVNRMNLALDTLVLFTDIAYRITIILSIVMMLITIGVAVFALFYKL
ncbi:MAG TPA: glycosyltransferase, partial [Bacteroidales bacterium]|nr:glycosyltransferase [Bacteroidales bacterium]